MEKSRVILSDKIRGESSVTSHIRKWNLRMRKRRFPSCSNRRLGRDILPCHARSFTSGFGYLRTWYKFMCGINVLTPNVGLDYLNANRISFLGVRIGSKQMKNRLILNSKPVKISDGSIPIQRSTKSTLTPCQKAIIFLNTSLIGLVVAKYQGGKSGDPFKANPAPSWSFLAAIVMYFLISLILMEFQSLPSFLSRVASASGVISSPSLISLLLPKLLGQILLYTSWALFGVISGWPILESAYNWLLTKIRIVTDGVISFAKNLFTGENTNGQQGLTGENTNSQQEGPPV